MVLRRRNRKKDDASETGRSGLASGCLAIVVELAVWVFSTLLVTLGVFLFLFGILDFSPEARIRTVAVVVLVPLAVLLLIRIGRQILDDLKGGDGS